MKSAKKLEVKESFGGNKIKITGIVPIDDKRMTQEDLPWDEETPTTSDTQHNYSAEHEETGTITMQQLSDENTEMTDTQNTVDQPQARRRRARRDRNIRHQLRRESCLVEFARSVVRFSLGLLLFLVMSIFIFVFGVLPLLLLLLSLLIVYYCCTSHPVPPRVLLRALFSPPEDANNPRLPQYSTQQIESSLIDRFCVEILHTDKLSIPQDLLAERIPLLSVRTRRLDGFVRYEEDGLIWILSKPQDDVRWLEKWDDFWESLTECISSRPPNSFESGIETGLANPENPPEDLDSFVEVSADSTGNSISSISGASVTVKHDPSSTCEDVDLSDGELRGALAKSEVGVQESESCAFQWNCDICLESFAVGDRITWSRNLQCSHAFHWNCIIDWLKRKGNCPTCRQQYVILEDSEGESHDVFEV